MRTIIAANWKMNKTRTEAKATAHELASILGGAPDDRDVVVFAPFTALEATREGLDGAPASSSARKICTPPNPGLSPARFPRPCSAKPVAHGCSRAIPNAAMCLGRARTS